MTGVCVFPKICVNHRQTDPVLVLLDMRASSLLLLTFIFTAAEYPLHIFGVHGKCGELKPEQIENKNYGNIPDNISYEEDSKFRMPCIEGYLRKAGTSNLFRCQKKDTHELDWNNSPELACISDPRKQRSPPDDPTTVANKQTPITAPNPTLSTLSSTEKPYFTTTGKTMDTSTTLGAKNESSLSSKAAGGIAAGTVLLLIVVAGSAAGIFIFCRRQDVSSTAVEMRQPPGVDHPLLEDATLPTSCPDSAQNPKTDPLIVVQQA